MILGNHSNAEPWLGECSQSLLQRELSEISESFESLREFFESSLRLSNSPRALKLSKGLWPCLRGRKTLGKRRKEGRQKRGTRGNRKYRGGRDKDRGVAWDKGVGGGKGGGRGKERELKTGERQKEER